MTVEHVETRRQTLASRQNYKQRQLKWVSDSAIGTLSKLVCIAFGFSTADVSGLAQRIHQAITFSNPARNPHHLKYSHKIARQPSSAMYKETQIAKP
jgi:hypothetical protein